MDRCFIGIKDLIYFCSIGAYPEERKYEQKLLIDIELEYLAIRAAKSDDLAFAVDYDEVKRVCQQASEKSYHLIESLANKILDDLFANFSIHLAKVIIKKPDIYEDKSYPYVRMERKP